MKKILLSTILLAVVICQPQIGDECTQYNGDMGYLDCQLNCVVLWYYDNWLGDGICDDVEHFYPAYFDCPEFGYDCGDCDEDWDGTDPLGFCSDDCTIPGDINGDENVNILDVVIEVNNVICWQMVFGCTEWFTIVCEDLNDDGNLNVLDIILMVNIILDG